jgi:hypothetical protein
LKLTYPAIQVGNATNVTAPIVLLVPAAETATPEPVPEINEIIA